MLRQKMSRWAPARLIVPSKMSREKKTRNQPSVENSQMIPPNRPGCQEGIGKDDQQWAGGRQDQDEKRRRTEEPAPHDLPTVPGRLARRWSHVRRELRGAHSRTTWTAPSAIAIETAAPISGKSSRQAAFWRRSTKGSPFSRRRWKLVSVPK